MLTHEIDQNGSSQVPNLSETDWKSRSFPLESQKVYKEEQNAYQKLPEHIDQ